ncbi:hypothetical protein DFH08DRAFT_874832 [Mycena albidolilacea]|uniref:Protein kinase domain-containing protein n=1 Tax=Mycena albidolilacea TaxID=1033008 RepID=A0AAD6ZVY1_9AGAR|nr:hypothetical protein DFH08DRAFT_874832 [Mycena albidolilacea]
MGDETRTNEDSSSMENPGYASYGVFSGSQHFTVAGGTFTNITNHHDAPTPPSDFRRIPLGDIDLQREIRLDWNLGVVSARTLRYHSAKIDRGTSSVTVAMYQGEKAEEEWRRDVAKYMAVRHPNIVQLWGTASFGNTYATIFHDDLIPLHDFLGLYQHSHFTTVYIFAYADAEFQSARDYFNSIFSRHLGREMCTPFIHCSSGRFCVDLVGGGWWGTFLGAETVQRQGLELLSTPHLESTIIDSLTTHKYHKICSEELVHRSQYKIRYWEPSQRQDILMTALENVNPGAIIFCPMKNPLGDDVDVEIATVAREIDYHIGTWGDFGFGGDIMEDGWFRVTSDDVVNNPIRFCAIYSSDIAWLSQANHVFSRLGITSNFEDYVQLFYILVEIMVSPTIPDPPEGYLFLCPPEQFHIGSSSKWPECPAYWSLHPSGIERLSWEDAARLGFPRIGILEYAQGQSWDSSVYEGLRQFHQAKGFDPDSQELALHLGEPLYELSSQTNPPFAHFREEEEHSVGEGSFRAPADSDDESEDILESAPYMYNGPGNSEAESQVILKSTHLNSGSTSLDEDSVAPSLSEEISVSNTFKFGLNVQLALILFHMLLWLVGRLA